MSARLNAGDTVKYGGSTYNISAVNGRQVTFSVDTATSCGMEQTINTSLPGAANSPNGAAGLVSQTAGLASAPAAAMEHASGKTRVGSNGRLYSANKATGRVFNGNKYVSTTSVAKLGRAASRGVAGVSQAADTVSVLNGDMSGGKYLLNTGVGALGLLGGPGGAATAVTYFGGDAIMSIFAEEAGGGIASPPPTIVDLPY